MADADLQIANRRHEDDAPGGRKLWRTPHVILGELADTDHFALTTTDGGSAAQS